MAKYEVIDGKGIIPEWATEIEAEAFKGCKELKSVVIPQWVRKIGNSAFYHCSALTIISIPSSVTEIGDWAFEFCSSLTHISIPESVVEIGLDAIRNCRSLRSINIPRSVEEIKFGLLGVFPGCPSIRSIKIDKNNPVYDSREDCNAIIHTESNTLLRGCQNTIIPESVTEIYRLAFRGCSTLTNIYIPPSVTEIGSGAFDECASLTNVKVSKNTKIAANAFNHCHNVQIERY